MGEKIVVGPINKGLSQYYKPFYIDNDSFPVLINAYQWRGRIKRKRGTALLNRLERYLNTTEASYIIGTISGDESPILGTPLATITLDGSGNGNLITGPYSSNDMPPIVFSLPVNSSIIPGTVTLEDTATSVMYTDPSEDGTLSPSGTINYATGEITIAAASGHKLTVIMNYYPELPVMGLRDLILNANTFPGNLAFDTKYAYNMLASAPYTIYDVSFYKNPPSGGSYTQKTDVTPVSWNGQNYQQFFTVNYQGALWATNGITDPFTTTNIGMQFAGPAGNANTNNVITYISNTATTFVVSITNSPLVVGDFVFFNEWTADTAADAAALNFQTGYVITISGSDITIKLPDAVLPTGGGVTYSPGIIQYLTNRSSTTKDCIRWYDGDPTNGLPFNPTLNGHLGWINFMPPLLSAPTTIFSIDDKPPGQYYLVGARIISVFKDRLLFFGPVIQTSSGSPLYLQDTVIYSQNGTPYYTASFDGSVPNAIVLPTTQYFPLLVPINQTATPNSFFEDVIGFGGFETAGFSVPITMVSTNEDVLLVGFTNRQVRLVYTGNPIVPFNFFVTNSELGTYSTFSAITFDRGVNSIGSHGIIMSQQIGAQRIDIDIPDQVFQFNLTNNGTERICSARDFINEWVYWTYSVNTVSVANSIFPNQTLQYNYRDNTWAIFNETYTAYGQFREVSGETWATIGETYSTWKEWEVPWNAGSSTLEQSKVIAGNQQGFVFLRDQGTTENESLSITDIKNTVVITNVTQANPAVVTTNNAFVVGELVTVNGVVGMTQLNGNTYTITAVSPTTITLSVNSSAFTAYISGGTITSSSIYSPNHCLNEGDYIIINGALGPVGPQVNGKIFSVQKVSLNSFDLNPAIAGGAYFGNGTITRMYVPFFQTKQFPTSWGMSRKTRLGAQQYCFTGTESGQIELQIYLSQNASNAYNLGPIVPSINTQNNSLIYSDIVLTTPEDYIQVCNNIPLGNIGNGSLTTITLNLFILLKFSSPIVPGTVVITIGNVATFTDDGSGGFTATGTGVGAGSSILYTTGLATLVFSVAPNLQTSSINFSYYYDNIQSPTADQQQQIWHRMNTSLLGDTVQLGFTMSDAQMRDVDINGQPLAQFEEIELHSIVLDVQPSQVLA